MHEFDLDDGTRKRPPWWFKLALLGGIAGIATLLAMAAAATA